MDAPAGGAIAAVHSGSVCLGAFGVLTGLLGGLAGLLWFLTGPGPA